MPCRTTPSKDAGSDPEKPGHDISNKDSAPVQYTSLVCTLDGAAAQCRVRQTSKIGREK